jgi:uncharacterized protein YneR
MHHQWMILSWNVIDYFRTSQDSFNYLAAMEHSLGPEENFFATVLFNSPQHRPYLIKDKKRLVRSIYDKWIGWSDRNLFPAGSSNPPYLFIRPFNAYGEIFEEGKLRDWIQANHLDQPSKSACKMADLGTRDECLKELVGPVAEDGEIILIAVNKAMLSVAWNLRCSLLRNNINNVLYWALDAETHNLFLEKGHLSYFIPDSQGSPEKLEPNSVALTRLLRRKAEIILNLVRADFNVWYLDADIVALREFQSRGLEYTTGELDADVVLAIGDLHPVPSRISVSSPPMPNAGMMYFKNTKNSKKFLDDVISYMKDNPDVDDQSAIRVIVRNGNELQFTGIGSNTFAESYPEEGELAHSGVKSANGNRSEEIFPNFVEQLTDFFSLGASKSNLVKVHFLDQLEFISGQIYFENPESIPDEFSSYRLIHGNGMENIEKLLREHDLWYLDIEGKCSNTIASPGETKGKIRN